ncbi:MAG: DUF1592 domain-containing protein [Myxococcales bacterium]
MTLLTLLATAAPTAMTATIAGCQASSTPTMATPEALCSQPSPGPAPIRRLSRFEYNNTVRDLLGDASNAGDLLPPEQKGNGFSNDAASLTTPPILVDSYRHLAHALSLTATQDGAALGRLYTCDVAAMGEDKCAARFVTEFGQRAFRRPLQQQEVDTLTGIYRVGRAGGTFAGGLAAVIEMALQSPQFLYRPEFGVPIQGSNLARVQGFEMASRLSYLLWGTTPSSELMAAAAAGKLDSKEQVLAQAKTMLVDPRARQVVRYFHDTLLGIDGIDGRPRNQEIFPTYKPDLAVLFKQETEQFVDHIVWEGPGDFATLFTGAFTYLNGPLAEFYGVPGITGNGFQRVKTDPTRRAGLLTQASILTMTTPGTSNNPVVRGKFIYTQLLCGQVPDPPIGLVVMEPPADPTLTTRERFLLHRQPSCVGCHVRLDDIGFGLENFNGVGLWQDTENGKLLDSSGKVPDGDVAGPFVGAVELGKKIANSRDARECFVGKWLDFAYARTEKKADACTRAALSDVFEGSGGNVQSLLLALTQTDAFMYRPLGAE